jgi:hypothetical protein
MAPGPTQPLKEKSTSNLPGGKGRGSRPVREADLTDIWADRLENAWASTSQNPTGLDGLLQG